MLFSGTKETAQTQIYKALKKAGKHGMFNYDLNKITWKFATRISELRRDGHNIIRVHIKNGVHKYYLNDEANQ